MFGSSPDLPACYTARVGSFSCATTGIGYTYNTTGLVIRKHNAIVIVITCYLLLVIIW